jgi:hypothetical protein
VIELDAIVARARDLLTFADGLEEAGLPEIARRSRMVARDVLELAEELTAERSARRSSQENYERARDVIARRETGAAAGGLPNPFLSEHTDAGQARQEGARHD